MESEMSDRDLKNSPRGSTEEAVLLKQEPIAGNTASSVRRTGLDFEPQSDAERAELSEAWALVSTFDDRLTEAEKRIDRVLARLGID